MPNFVLDTNVLVSAFIARSPEAPARRALALARQAGIVCFSAVGLSELRAVLERPRFAPHGATPETISRFVDMLSVGAMQFEPTITVRECRDGDDDKFLELALACDAACLVSGDADLRAMHPWRGIPILGPAGFIMAAEAGGSSGISPDRP